MSLALFLYLWQLHTRVHTHTLDRQYTICRVWSGTDQEPCACFAAGSITLTHISDPCLCLQDALAARMRTQHPSWLPPPKSCNLGSLWQGWLEKLDPSHHTAVTALHLQLFKRKRNPGNRSNQNNIDWGPAGSFQEVQVVLEKTWRGGKGGRRGQSRPIPERSSAFNNEMGGGVGSN